MLQVEGKTFHKFVELKSYKTQTFKDHCNLKNKYSYNDCMNTKNGNFFYDETHLSEDEFVKNFGNKFAQVHFTRQRVFIEESEKSISLKAQYYHKWRNVGQRYFVVRKQTNYFSFNFKTKMFYSGLFKGKNKTKIGNSMKVDPSYRSIRDLEYTLKIDDSIRTESYFYFFLEKIWDRLGLENPLNFETRNPFTHYSLTKYLIKGVKIPNNWIQYTDTFVPIKTLRSCNMNLVDGLMRLMKLKGSKVKRILNEFEYVNFDRLTGLYYLLGIDRFNKLPDKIFDYSFSKDGLYSKRQEIPVGGEYWYCMSEDYQKDFISKLPYLTSKEKDRILYLSEHLDDGVYNSLIEHLHFKKKLMELGEDVKLKFENRSQFNEEHEEFSRLLNSYRKGEIERYYGEIDSLETPFKHEGETYYPVLLKKSIDYEKESQHQRNCVRTYAERPDCIIFSIRKGSDTAEERITVEYRFTKNEILNVQERARFNELPNETFSQVARVQLVNINLMYKIGTLKLPKMIKRYRSGKVVEQNATFEIDLDNGTRVIPMTPRWDHRTDEFNTWQYDILEQVPNLENDFWDELPI